MFLVVCYQWNDLCRKTVCHRAMISIAQYAHSVVIILEQRSTDNRHEKQHHLFLFGMLQLKDNLF